MPEPFIIEGDLWFKLNEGASAGDAWIIQQDEQRWGLPDLYLDTLVAKHFDAKRMNLGKNDYRSRMRWHHGQVRIGQVRITIEKLDDARPDAPNP